MLLKLMLPDALTFGHLILHAFTLIVTAHLLLFIRPHRSSDFIAKLLRIGSTRAAGAHAPEIGKMENLTYST